MYNQLEIAHWEAATWGDSMALHTQGLGKDLELIFFYFCTILLLAIHVPEQSWIQGNSRKQASLAQRPIQLKVFQLQKQTIQSSRTQKRINHRGITVKS
jgi:hypothetical protein